MRPVILALLLTIVLSPTSAQTRYTVSGTIRDRKSGEPMIRATVTAEGTGIGVTSNQYGFYSITLAQGTYILSFSTVGMKIRTDTVTLNRNIPLDIILSDDTAGLAAVVVSASSGDHKLQGTQMGVDRLSMKTIHEVPVFLGETDVLKTIELLPGVASAGEGSTGFYVRGGAPDQNLILLDGTTVYNPSHLLGLFSTFNGDAIRDVTVYKGAMPPQYGGRLSSVEDVRMNDGNNQAYHGEVSDGLLTTSAEVEGPLQKGGSSFLVAGRTTRINMFLSGSHDSTINKDRVGFYDVNVKLNIQTGKQDHLYLSGYFGQDNLSIYQTFGLKYGNTAVALRWNHVFGSKLFTNTAVSYSGYDTWITAYVNASSYQVKSTLSDYSFRQDWEWYASPSNTIKFGLASTTHTIAPAKLTAQANSGLNDSSFESRYGLENALYLGDDWKIDHRLTFSVGARLTAFTVLGPGNFYGVDANGEILDTTHFGSNQTVKTYVNPEPRLALGYPLSDLSTVKASYTRNVQNVHLLSNSALSIPTDKWVLTNNNILPEITDQYSLGYYGESGEGVYSWSVETYYKTMQHQIDYRTGAQLETTDVVETDLLYGKGRAYGVETQLKKNRGKLTGWISYTWSRSQLQIHGINNNQWYDATQDRTHNAAIVAIYNPNAKWTWSACWVYYTGNPVSYPSGKYIADGRVVFYYSERNGYRLPPYHRLDLAGTRHWPKKKWYQLELSFGVYNAYDRQNAYLITFRQDPNDASETQARQTTLLGIVPYATLTLKF
jgi:CarboxypepD_reg-like domain/TonB-dependent Receptor Plug Domain